MRVIEHSDPKFVATRSFIFGLNDGTEVIVERGEPMDLKISESHGQYGAIIYGSGQTVLGLTTKTTINDLLDRVKPASFDLKLEEDNELSLVAAINEASYDKKTTFQLIPHLDVAFEVAGDVIGVTSIRSIGD